MKVVKIFASVFVFCLFLTPIFYAGAQESQPPAQKAPEEGSAMKAQNLLCNPEHMRMMLEQGEDKVCVVNGVLGDEEATNIIMDKIAQDPTLRKQMMEKIQMEMHKRMMEQKGMMEGEGSGMKEEGSGMKNESGREQ